MNRKIHPSVNQMWEDFIKENNEYKSHEMPESWYFCDNKMDANECADLVVNKVKQATSTSLWWYEKNNERLPKSNDIYIVTDWDGMAKAIIRTTKVNKVPFNHITKHYAEIEGEGNKSLEYWKKIHWDYFTREMKPFGAMPSEKMIIVCEQFETIWDIKSNSC